MIYLGSVTEHTLAFRGATSMSRPPDLVQGTLDLLVLTILAVEPMNGHAIGLRLQQMSDEVLKVSDGSLYPALHKLEQEGWLTASWETTANNRRAKVYALSRSGRKRLEKETENWLKLSGAITQLVHLTRT
jgi:PadR family transcriptional regulator, regulatory protein PadR